MSKPYRSAGFTRLDLLASIAIFGLLLGQLLPAVEQDREAARGLQCSGKLKQLALALQNHHDVFNKLPPSSYQGSAKGVASVWWPLPGSASKTGAAPSAGYTTDAGTEQATAGYSWVVRILPYLDEQPLYNAINQASQKFTIDAFTPYDVPTGPAAPGRAPSFSVSTVVAGNVLLRHFAVLPLDEVACPDFNGSMWVASSMLKSSPPQPKSRRAQKPPTA